MSSATQGSVPTEQVVEEQLTYEKKPVEDDQVICDVEDGNAFIEDIAKEIKLEVKTVNIGVGDKVHKFHIRQLGIGDINEVFQGDWRVNPLEGELKKKFDSIEKAERMFILSLQKAVVKKDGKTSLWEAENVLHMVQGPDAPKYTDILQSLYHEVCNLNPTLLPHLNPMALKMLFQWW